MSMHQIQVSKGIERSVLSMLVKGMGQLANGFTVDTDTGFALWFEQNGRCVDLKGKKQAKLVFARGVPYIDIFAVDATDTVRMHEMRVPCVDILGMVEIGDEKEMHRDELAQERQARTVH